jgi:hypothetical protein
MLVYWKSAAQVSIIVAYKFLLLTIQKQAVRKYCNGNFIK